MPVYPTRVAGKTMRRAVSLSLFRVADSTLRRAVYSLFPGSRQHSAQSSVLPSPRVAGSTLRRVSLPAPPSVEKRTLLCAECCFSYGGEERTALRRVLSFRRWKRENCSAQSAVPAPAGPESNNDAQSALPFSDVEKAQQRCAECYLPAPAGPEVQQRCAECCSSFGG